MHRRWIFSGTILCILFMLTAAGCQKRVIAPGGTVASPGAGAGVDDAERQGVAEGMDEEDLPGGAMIDEGPVDEIVTADGVVMNRERFINEDIFFEFDSSALSAEAQSILKAKAEWMARNPHLNIIIEGHCDNRGTTEYNLALGERRAESVKRFLMDLGIPDNRIRTISFGEERPLALGDDETAWAKNRRAHFEFD